MKRLALLLPLLLWSQGLRAHPHVMVEMTSEVIFVDGKVAAMQMEINDFAATPGVISLRLAQALEELSA